MKIPYSQSESSILYHVVQMDQSESRKFLAPKKDVKATQKKPEVGLPALLTVPEVPQNPPCPE